MEDDRYIVKVNGRMVDNGLSIHEAVQTCEFYLQTGKNQNIVINIEKERAKNESDKKGND